MNHTPFSSAFLASERELGDPEPRPDACRACGTAGHSIQNCPAIRAEMEDAPGPDHDTRGEPATLRRTINDAINTYIAYECETDSERATELAVEYMFSEYGLKDGPLEDAPTSWSDDPKRVQWHADHPPYDAGPAEYDDWVMDQIAALRAQLATAHEIVGGVRAAIESVRADYPGDVFTSESGAGAGARLACDRILTYFDDAARAWLRRA